MDNRNGINSGTPDDQQKAYTSMTHLLIMRGEEQRREHLDDVVGKYLEAYRDNFGQEKLNAFCARAINSMNGDITLSSKEARLLSKTLGICVPEDEKFRGRRAIVFSALGAGLAFVSGGAYTAQHFLKSQVRGMPSMTSDINENLTTIAETTNGDIPPLHVPNLQSAAKAGAASVLGVAGSLGTVTALKEFADACYMYTTGMTTWDYIRDSKSDGAAQKQEMLNHLATAGYEQFDRVLRMQAAKSPSRRDTKMDPPTVNGRG